MDSAVKRRRLQPLIFAAVRGIIVAGFLAFLVGDIALLEKIVGLVVDRTGNGFQVQRSYIAAEAFPAGSVVSFGQNWTLRRGLAVSSTRILDNRIAGSCANAEYEAGLCRWSPYATNDGTAILQFQLSPLNLPTVSLSVAPMVLSGTIEMDDVVDVSLQDVAAQLMHRLPSEAAAATAVVERLTIVAAAASADTATFGALLLVTVASEATNTTATAYAVASGSLETGASTTALIVLDSDGTGSVPGTSDAGSQGFVQVLPTGLLLGIACGGDVTCVALLDPLNLASTLATLSVPVPCPFHAAAMGNYSALGVNPVAVLWTRRGPPSSAPSSNPVTRSTIELTQIVSLPWTAGALDALISVPWTHPSKRFVVVSAAGHVVQWFSITPSPSPSAAANKSLAFSVGRGGSLQSTFPLSVETATFASPTADVYITLVEAGLRYLVKGSILNPQLSAPIFLDVAQLAPFRAAAYDPAGGATALGGPGVRAGEAELLLVNWIGGITVAGIAQEDGAAGQQVAVLRNGVSGIHTNLEPNLRYTSDRFGNLVPFVGAQSYSSISANSDQDPHSLATLSTRMVVGAAVSATELFVWLH